MVEDDWKSVDGEPCVYRAPAGPRTPVRFKLRMEIRFPGDGRSVRQWTFYDLDTARAKRREVRVHRHELDWLRREFGWAYTGGDTDEGSGMTLLEYVEAGVEETSDGYVAEENPPLRGWLYDYVISDSGRDRIYAWSTLRDRYGALNDLTIQDLIDPGTSHLRALVGWLAADDAIESYDTAQSYLGIARSIVSDLAEYEGESHRVNEDADINPAKHSTSRVQPLSGEQIREWGALLIQRVKTCNRQDWKQMRALALTLFRVHRDTGARVRELLALRPGDVLTDPPGLRITRTATRDGDFRPPKEIQSGEPRPEYAKFAPISEGACDHLLRWIRDWRPQLGFPSIDDTELLFAAPDGGVVSDESIRTHYTAAAELSDDPQLKQATPRQIRNSVLTRLKEMGCPQDLRAAIAGHQSPGVQDRYDHAAVPERAREFVEGLWAPEGDIPDPPTLADVL